MGCTDSSSYSNIMVLPTEKVSNQQLEARLKDTILQMIQSNNAYLRCHALETLALAKIDLDSPALIHERMFDNATAVRFAAAMAAGDMQDYSAKPLLEQMLRENNPSVKMAAAYALEKMGDKRFSKWYDKILMGNDDNYSSQACLILGRLGNKGIRQNSRSKLWRVIQKDNQSAAVRLQAAESLAKLGDKTILKNLLVYSSSGFASDRILAISGLSYLTDNAVHSMLAALAEDDQIEVQLSAIRALKHLAEPKHVALMRSSLTYADPEGNSQNEDRVKGLALLAVGSVGNQEDAVMLYKGMDAPSHYIQIAAARATVDYLKRYSIHP